MCFSKRVSLNAFPVQTFLYDFLDQGQRDKEAEAHADGADTAGIDPTIEGGAGDAPAGAAAKKAPGMSGSKHG